MTAWAARMRPRGNPTGPGGRRSLRGLLFRIPVPTRSLTRPLWLVLGDGANLGSKLMRHYVYESDRKTQIQVRSRIRQLLEDPDKQGLISLCFDEDSRVLLEKLMALRAEPNWRWVLDRWLGGLCELLDRELNRATAVYAPPTPVRTIEVALRRLPISSSGDLMKVREKQTGLFEVNYLNRAWSPDCDGAPLGEDGEFEPWRHTQFIFVLNFTRNLLVWQYINVHPRCRGKGIGTAAVGCIEAVARELGITRASVEYPHRRFWPMKLGYHLPYRYRIGWGRCQYTIEAYKEL